MNKQREVPHAVSGAFVFLLLGMFAVFSTVLVLLGARAYRSISARSAVNDTSRMASYYLRSMLRAEDAQDAVSLMTEKGVEVIALHHTYDGEEYITRVYVYDGMLHELFTEADMEFEPENGEEVCPAQSMTAAAENGLLTVRVETGAGWNEVCLALRAAAIEGGTP